MLVGLPGGPRRSATCPTPPMRSCSGRRRHKPAVYADPPPAHAFPDDPVSVDVSYQSGLDDVAPPGDEGRAGLNVDPGQVVDIRQGRRPGPRFGSAGGVAGRGAGHAVGGADVGRRRDVVEDVVDIRATSCAPWTTFGGALDESATPLDDVAGGPNGGVSRVDADNPAPEDGGRLRDDDAARRARRPVTVRRRTGTITVSDDTQAVVDAIPGRRVPEDFDVLKTLDEIEQAVLRVSAGFRLAPHDRVRQRRQSAARRPDGPVPPSRRRTLTISRAAPTRTTGRSFAGSKTCSRRRTRVATRRRRRACGPCLTPRPPGPSTRTPT